MQAASGVGEDRPTAGARRDGTPGVRAGVMVAALLVTPLCYAAGFPPGRHAWLAWIGIVPWGVAVRLVGVRAGLALTLWVTFLGSYLCTPWLSQAVANYYQQPLALGVALFAGVYLVTVGPFIAVFTFVFQALARRPSAWFPLLAGMAWAGAELGRARLFVGDPFGLFGYTQIEWLPLIQVADATGVYGISALLFAFNTSLSELVLAWPRARAAIGDRDGHGHHAYASPSQGLWGVALPAP